jgi:hypothetical protein
MQKKPTASQSPNYTNFSPTQLKMIKRTPALRSTPWVSARDVPTPTSVELLEKVTDTFAALA